MTGSDQHQTTPHLSTKTKTTLSDGTETAALHHFCDRHTIDNGVACHRPNLPVVGADPSDRRQPAPIRPYETLAIYHADHDMVVANHIYPHRSVPTGDGGRG